MATIFPLGTQFFDAVGEPLADGTISFYTATTLTPKAIYTTSSQSVQLTNPLELDSEGRVPSAGVWCIGSYRVIIKDADGVPIYDLDNLNLYNPVDWTGLTATIADINAVAGALGTAGVVVASKAVVVDASKNISSFGTLTGATLRATTAVRTPQVNDANNVAAITIPGVASQVNSITVTPAVTTASPSVTATGSDSNIDLTLAGKGTGAVKLSGLKYPVADGSAGTFMQTNGSGVLSLAAIPVATQVVKQVVTNSSATYSAITAVIPADDTIPQISEGTEIVTCTITPTSASSSLYIFANGMVGSAGTTTATLALFRDATSDAIMAGAAIAITYGCEWNLATVVSSVSTSSTTIRLRIGPPAGTIEVNGANSGRKYGGVASTRITIMEI